MPALQLPLIKPGDVAQKLALNLSKGGLFKIRLSWDGETDLDLHAMVATNTGASSKISALEDILSPYNVKRVIRGQETGTLPLAADKTFSIYNGALVHSPDATDGNKTGDDEYILIHPDRLTPPAGGALEIPLVAMIHPQKAGNKFSNVQNARVSIENENGQSLLDVSLSNQFGEFIGVQMGSIMIEASGASFVAIGTGFNQDFNQVINHFA